MSAVVVHCEGLSKSYHRGALQHSTLLRDHLSRMLKSPFSVFRRTKDEVFWALENVSLEVREGEVLGLIGRNGAGKTTLLKILSRITKPTAGWAEIHGRVGSLLEVGTGFHPELTGRENTFLSGAILGMGKSEIKRKFDEIVAFAELEQFIDTPVKHYSSGMYVRLAFAVAAHLEPEILLVDEVLAVGDVNFQRKCLGKMGNVARQGRTIVLVSHQMNQMRRLCHRIAWVDAGKIKMTGETHEVANAYESSMARGYQIADPDREGERLQQDGVTKARFVRWQIGNGTDDAAYTLSTLGQITVSFILEVIRPIEHGEHGVALFSADRQLIWARAVRDLAFQPGIHILSFKFPILPLRPAPYQWQVTIWEQSEMLDHWDCLPELNVATEIHQHHMDQWNGILNLPADFDSEALKETTIGSTRISDAGALR
ncbi:MAG: ABC transporter ATP-binding protein [Terriglobales bacterium]|jgi:ABC-type polysaccharide/polyol phosphate transport system ATPase subunit